MSQSGETEQLLARQYINHPQLRLLLDFVNNDHSWGSVVLKDPSVSLLPLSLGCKHH